MRGPALALLLTLVLTLGQPLSGQLSVAHADGHFDDGMEFFNSFINGVLFSKNKKKKAAGAARSAGDVRAPVRRPGGRPAAASAAVQDVDIPLPIAKCIAPCSQPQKAPKAHKLTATDPAADTKTDQVGTQLPQRKTAPVAPARPAIAARQGAARPPAATQEKGRSQDRAMVEQPTAASTLAKAAPVAAPVGKPPVSKPPVSRPTIAKKPQNRRPAAHTPRPVAAAEHAGSKIRTARYDRCLPPDLYRLLRANRPHVPGLAVCKPVCQPVPAGLAPAQRQLLTQKHGLNWCADSCLRIGAHLPLKDIERIEKMARVTVCVTPVRRLLPVKVEAPLFGRSYPRIRTAFAPAQPGLRLPARVAILIGNRHYTGSLPENRNAHRDIAALYTVLRERGGLRRTDIIDLRDATAATLLEVFGTAEQPGIGLQALLRGRRDVELLIYYSGYATAGTDDAMLLPTDAPSPRSGGYRLSQLYGALRKMAPRRTLLVLETDFARDMSGNIPLANLATRQVALAPSPGVPGLTIITAAQGDQKSLEDPAYQTGLFTRYFVEALSGAAGQAPFGNSDRHIDALEAYIFAANKTRKAALKSFGVRQTPTLVEPSMPPTALLSTAPAGETVIAERR